jgi:hypothetical protein
MTDLTVLQGCRIRNRGAGSGEPVRYVTRHAAQRYLERVEGMTGPFDDAELARAGRAVFSLFAGRIPLAGCEPASALDRVPPYEGAAPLHAGRIHVFVVAGKIVTLLPLGAPAAGCGCKSCERHRRRLVAKYRRAIDRRTRDGLRIELEQKRPQHRRQLAHSERNAGRAGRGAALREQLATA